jgi:hypothetical protein
MHALNLLHYPSLTRQQKVFHRWWSSLAGLLLGGAMAWVWLQWQDLQTASLQQEQSLLQANLAKRTQLAKEALRRQTQSRLEAEQVAHLKQVAQHQQAWAALHDSLQTEARQGGLRLERLQAEAEKIEFHGMSPHVDAITHAQQRLSDQLAHPLALASITTAPHEGVRFVWQAVWPPVQGASVVPLPRASGAQP